MVSPVIPGVWQAAEVLSVWDGDTFTARVTLPDATPYPCRVRIAGLNAPERRGRTTAAGWRARQKLWALLTGAAVDVAAAEPYLDRYGRVIAWVRAVHPPPGGFGLVTTLDVAARLVSDGVAWPFMASGLVAMPAL